jgi:hypothetical protein
VVGAKDDALLQELPQHPLNMIQQIQQAAQNFAVPGNNVAQAVVPAQAAQVQNVAPPPLFCGRQAHCVTYGASHVGWKLC